MTNEERIALILDIKGQEGVAALTKELEKEKAELRDLSAAFKRGEMTIAEFIERQSSLRAGIVQIESTFASLKGSTGASGRGLLGASYAFQDFTSQINNGFVPALASIQNNIPQILAGMGVGAGMQGAISAVAVAAGLAIPLMRSMFGAQTQKEIDEAKEKLKEFEEQIKKVHEAFIKMSEKPTTPEEEFAANLKAIFETRGNADVIRGAIAGGITGQEVEAGMTETEKAGRRGKVDMTDAEIAATANIEAQRVDPKTGAITPGDPTEVARIRGRLMGQRRTEAAVRARLAEGVMSDAIVGGPAGDAARRRLAGAPLPQGLARELAGVTPEVMEASDRADEEFDEKNQRAHEARVKREAAAKAKAKRDAESQRAADRAVEVGKQLDATEERENERINKAVDDFEKDSDRIVKRSEMHRAREAQQQSRRQLARMGVELERYIDDTIEDARRNGATAEQLMMLMSQAKQMRRQHQDQVFRNQQSMIGSGLDN